MAEVNLNGLGVALITPFKEDLSIDFDSLGNIIEHVIKGGCDYLVVLGTTAETPTLSYEEKLELTRFIKNHTEGRVPLVLGIGGNNTAAVVQDILKRDLNGYSAILSVAPYYNKPTQEGLYLHFMAIAEASPLPVILYNVPGRTGVNISPETILRLASSSSNICAVKEASGNLLQCEEIIKKSPERFSVISGNDGDTAALMNMGAVGVISVLANALPLEMKNLISHCQQKDLIKAKNCQDSFSVLIKHLFEDGNPAGVKVLLKELGFAKNILRLPLVPACKNVEEKILSEFHTLLH